MFVRTLKRNATQIFGGGGGGFLGGCVFVVGMREKRLQPIRVCAEQYDGTVVQVGEAANFVGTGKLL